jgi:hypothetical protein
MAVTVQRVSVDLGTAKVDEKSSSRVVASRQRGPSKGGLIWRFEKRQNFWVTCGEHLRRPDGTIPANAERDFAHLAQCRFAP